MVTSFKTEEPLSSAVFPSFPFFSSLQSVSPAAGTHQGDFYYPPSKLKDLCQAEAEPPWSASELSLDVGASCNLPFSLSEGFEPII
jgi:hypothetical protein